MGFTLHPLLQLCRRRGWLEFVDLTPQEFSESLYHPPVPTGESEEDLPESEEEVLSTIEEQEQ